MNGFSGRVAAALSATLALLALLAAPALAEKGKVGDESMELRASLASFYGPRSAPATTVDPRAFVSAATAADSMPPINGTTWDELGPYDYNPDAYPQYLNPDSNVGSGGGHNTGRITGIAAAPDGSIYAAGAGGGIWRSSDGGNTWTPLFDGQATTAEGTVAVVRTGAGPDDYTVYAGTGEPTINLDSYAGIGILGSSDKGATWHLVGGDALAGAAVFKIVPDGAALLAATSHGLYRLDGPGATWTRVIGADTTGAGNSQVLNLVSDVAVNPANQDEVVAVRGWRAGASTNGLYVSYDGGRTFSGPLQPQGYAPQNAQGRGTIAYSSDGRKLYVMLESPVAFANGGGGTVLTGIYLSTRDVKGPFNQIASPSVLMNSGSAQKPGAIGTGYKPGVQAWYNQFLIVDPNDSSHLYAGLEEVYETTDAGKSWVTAAPYWNLTLKCFQPTAPDYGGCPSTTHSDQHAAAIAGDQVWIGNDGGVYSRPLARHTAGGYWTDHNTHLGTLQYYYADSGTTGGNTVIWGGLQDNGTSKQVISSFDPFVQQEASQPFGGDGGATLVDPANGDNVLTEYTDLTPAITHDGGRTWTDVAPSDPHPQFIAPIEADSASPSRDLYAGGEILWHSAKGYDTTASDWQQAFDTGAGHSISAIAVSGGTGYAAYCGPCWPGYVSGTGFGRGLIADTGGGTWHKLDLTTVPSGCDAVPNRYITGIAIDPADANHAYISVSGYARHWMVGPDDPGTGHVFETRDGGTCWHDVSGTLIDAPANDVLLLGAGRLVVATDVGVFASNDDGASWGKVGTNLPNTIVDDLGLTPGGGILAATHGRGLWQISQDALTPPAS